METKHRQQLAAGDGGPLAHDFHAAETARRAKHESARQVRYELKNFQALRSRDDFSRGIVLSKLKVASVV